MGRISRDARGHFIKRAIPASVRLDLAIRHGCPEGGSINVVCHYCASVGSIHWIKQPTDRARGWIAFSGLEMDHIKSEFLGGNGDSENIVLACRKCNRGKGIKSTTELAVAA
jgi:5-methylcytosine-specific restriction endonuclease McrA